MSVDWAAVAAAGAAGISAVVTAVMAYETRKMARSTQFEAEAVAKQVQASLDLVAVGQQQVAAAENAAAAALEQSRVATLALQADSMPWIVPEWESVASELRAGRISFALDLRNIGKGIALVAGDVVFHPSRLSAVCLETRFGKISSGVLPPHGTSHVVFSWELAKQNHEDWKSIEAITGQPNTSGEWSWDLSYTDAAGGQPTTLTVTVTGDRPPGAARLANWRATRASYHHPGDPGPSVTARFGS